jgi:peroxiredoxin
MPALTPGAQAPDFSLPTSDGKQFSLKEARKKGPVVLAFFKISCPVCQYAFPFFERWYKAYGDRGLTLVGVSEDNRHDTELFRKQFGVTFPIALDDTEKYPASNAYRLTNVPTFFWISQEGKVEVSAVGWDRKEFEEIGRRMAKASSLPPVQLIAAGEQVADFRPG